MCDLFVNVSNGVVWFVCHYSCLYLCGRCLMCVCFVCGVLCDVVGVCCCAFLWCVCLFVCLFSCVLLCVLCLVVLVRFVCDWSCGVVLGCFVYA